MSSNIERIGKLIAVYGTALVLIWIGIFKYTPTEAKAIEPLVRNSPFMSWMYDVGSVQAVSNFIGTFEIVTGLLLCLFPFHKRASFVGGLLSIIIFLTTISFLFTTPGMFATVDGIYVPTSGAFILKDIVMLGVSVWVVTDQYMHIKMEKRSKT